MELTRNHKSPVLNSFFTSAAANHKVKQQYVNGHFCYAYKFGIMTNGLDIVVEKKSKSSDEDKSLANLKALIPTLKDFKEQLPLLIYSNTVTKM